jgi:ATP/maltotriose-dependent transcriptional regulator MalT
MQKSCWSNSDRTQQGRRRVSEEAHEQGLLILDSSLRVVYRDHQAWSLCNLINHLEQGKAAKGIIPHKVFEACLEIAEVLQANSSIEECDPLQIEIVLGNREKQVVVRAIGLPDSYDRSQSQILLIFEEASYRLRRLARTAQKQFHLSEKETLVVQYLLNGWTNKEIANEIRVCEQTIKEHIKHTMKKTKSVTRTGIIIAISGVTQQYSV